MHACDSINLRQPPSFVRSFIFMVSIFEDFVRFLDLIGPPRLLWSRCKNEIAIDKFCTHEIERFRFFCCLVRLMKYTLNRPRIRMVKSEPNCFIFYNGKEERTNICLGEWMTAQMSYVCIWSAKPRVVYGSLENEKNGETKKKEQSNRRTCNMKHGQNLSITMW